MEKTIKTMDVWSKRKQKKKKQTKYGMTETCQIELHRQVVLKIVIANEEKTTADDNLEQAKTTQTDRPSNR